jgi:hypothetical protein
MKVAIHDNKRPDPTVGEALLRAIAGRRIRHEDAERREVWRGLPPLPKMK